MLRASIRRGLLLAVTLGMSAPAVAQDRPSDPPLAIPADAAQLTWSPCPPFMPEGCGIAVLRGDPSKPNADVFFKVPAGAVIPDHWHTSAERMVLVSGQMTVTYQGQKPITLKPGTYAYGPPKAPHKATCGQNGPCVLFIAFELPVDAFPTEKSRP